MEHEKEIVTLKDIKTDILKPETHAVISDFILVASLCIVLALLNLIFQTKIITIVIIAFALGYLAEQIYRAICAYKIWKGTYFTIRTDVMVGGRDYVPGMKWVSPKPPRLYFKYGYFDIPLRTNYTWSYSHQMEAKTVFDTAFVGDTFTLIETKKKILMAYNHKFFDVDVP